MRKIPTVFLRDPDDRAHVLPEINPACQWVLDGEGVATRKYDGTCVMLDESGEWWARREVKPGKTPPPNYVPVQTDETTGKTMGWEPIKQSAFAKFHAEALDREDRLQPGTYELLGPKINGNPESWDRHGLLRHSQAAVVGMPRTITYDSLRRLFLETLAPLGYEGVVWHREIANPNTEMAKLKVKDFRKDAA